MSTALCPDSPLTQLRQSRFQLETWHEYRDPYGNVVRTSHFTRHPARPSVPACGDDLGDYQTHHRVTNIGFTIRPVHPLWSREPADDCTIADLRRASLP